VSCQNLERGHYTAYRHLAEEDLDVVLHLGDHQRGWLLDGLDRSQARWNVLAQQVVMAELDLHPGPGRSWYSDAWDGHAADRDRASSGSSGSASRPTRSCSPATSTPSWSATCSSPAAVPTPPVVATELVGTSISSGASKSTGFRKHLEDNPHIRLFEIRLRGYTRCTVIRERWYADLRVVDTIERRSAPVRTLATYVVENDRPGAEQV
jgi:alkaline phosphatase D